MAQISLEKEHESITMDSNMLLQKLKESYHLLQKLNKEIESRPFATRIHGHFDHELKKSQSIISKLSSLLRKYYSFESTSSACALSSLEIKAEDESSTKPIDTLFVIDFKDICLKIEREWRIGTKLITDCQSKYGRKHYHHDSEHYHSDNETQYSHKTHYKHTKTSCSQSSAIHSFSNPNSPLFTPSKEKKQLPSLNLSKSQSQLVQLQKQTFLKDKEYHAKIGSDFVPFDEEQRLNQQIRDINDDLQYLLAINKQMNELTLEQGKNVDNMHKNVSKTHNNIQQATDTLCSIRKSPLIYGVMGGMLAASFSAPIVLIGAGVKAVIGSTIGFGTIGAFTASLYANKVNEQMDEDNKSDKEKRLLNDQSKDGMDINMNKTKGFQTRPRKRTNVDKTHHFVYSDDDDDDIEVWDARN